MKNILATLLFCLALLSCSEDPDSSSSEGIIGQWQLSEVYSDPGDGSGEYEEVTSDVILEFKEDGTFSSSGNICNLSSDETEGSSGTYSLEDNSILADDCQNHLINIAEVSKNQLTITYPCIEGCGVRYRKRS